MQSGLCPAHNHLCSAQRIEVGPSAVGNSRAPFLHRKHSSSPSLTNYNTMLRTSIAAVTRAAPRHVRGIARVAPIAVSHATSTGSRAAGTIKTDQGLELKTDLQKEVRPRSLTASVELDDRAVHVNDAGWQSGELSLTLTLAAWRQGCAPQPGRALWRRLCDLLPERHGRHSR